ncbi:hypothetical protein ACJX0J_022176 [Zea mays]
MLLALCLPVWWESEVIFMLFHVFVFKSCFMMHPRSIDIVGMLFMFLSQYHHIKCMKTSIILNDIHHIAIEADHIRNVWHFLLVTLVTIQFEFLLPFDITHVHPGHFSSLLFIKNLETRTYFAFIQNRKIILHRWTLRIVDDYSLYIILRFFGRILTNMIDPWMLDAIHLFWRCTISKILAERVLHYSQYLEYVFQAIV